MARTQGSGTLIPIERLENRIEFLAEWFEPSPDYIRRLVEGKIEFMNVYNASSLFDVITSEMALPKEGRHFRKVPTKKTLQNYARDNECSAEFIDYVSRLYSVSRHALSLRYYDDFVRAMGKDTQAMDRWKAANGHLMNNRGDLAIAGKKYYLSIDELPEDFPLVGKKDWILDPPLLLKLNSDIPAIGDAPPLQPRKLAGLGLDTASFRHRRGLRERMKRFGAIQHNGESYKLMSVAASSGRLALSFAVTKYFDYVNTCEANALELADWHLQDKNRTSIGNPMRPFAERPDEIMNLSNRAAYCGVNCLTIIRKYTDAVNRRPSDVFFIHPRDGNRTEARNTIHVIPAGGHQPPTAESRNPLNSQIFMTVCREFFEEMFDEKEFAKQSAASGTFFDIPNARRLYEQFFEGERPAAKVYFHGFGLDPVTTKPEMLVTILVDWDSVKRKVGQPEFRYSSEGDGIPRPLSEAELLRQARGYAETLPDTAGPLLPTLPAGAGCMILAARRLGWLKQQVSWD